MYNFLVHSLPLNHRGSDSGSIFFWHILYLLFFFGHFPVMVRLIFLIVLEPHFHFTRNLPYPTFPTESFPYVSLLHLTESYSLPVLQTTSFPLLSTDPHLPPKQVLLGLFPPPHTNVGLIFFRMKIALTLFPTCPSVLSLSFRVYAPSFPFPCPQTCFFFKAPVYLPRPSVSFNTPDDFVLLFLYYPFELCPL